MARPYYNPSPSFPFLAGLFGQDTTFNKRKGTYKLGGPSAGGGLFGPQAAGDISGYLNLTGNNAYTQALGNIGQSGNFQGLPPELRDAYYQATGTLDQLIGSSRPVVDSMIQTGMPVDIGSVVEAAKSRFTNQFIPEAAERYNPATGTGFANIAAREANLMGTELGALDYQAQEAARGRQENAIGVLAPALASLSSARLALPSATLSELSSLSQTSDPGGRLLAALNSLLGSSQQPSERDPRIGSSGGGGGGSGLGDILGSVGSLVGIVAGLAGCWVAEELFGPADERTANARLWCAFHPDHPFVQAYQREGREWAAWLSNNPWARPLAEPTWQWMADEGARIAAQLN